MSRPDPGQRQRHRQQRAAHLLAKLLTEHPDLPLIDWTVSQHALYTHFYLCHVDPFDQRDAFTAWTTVLGLAHAQRPTYRVIDDEKITAYRTIDDTLVIITASLHPF